MKKASFSYLVDNFTSLSPKETSQVLALYSQYPYSQVIHCLAARSSHDQQLKSKEQFLHQAAVYATDRSVLKTIMTRPPVSRIEPIATGKPIAPPIVEKPTNIGLSGDQLLDEIHRDLELLKENKDRFEASIIRFEAGLSYAPLSDKPARRPRRKDHLPEDGLIREIKGSKKMVSPRKEREQDEIIDLFIKYQPKIEPKSEIENSGDLAMQSLKNIDNVVSETLVEVLLKQGKTEKAIEVLKKLIWKFPQKKAYFATQIEALKK